MKIDRMLETIILLLKHESLSARQLAERFGVSVRTIQRDMESLSVAGIPITTSPGAKGGYAILSSYKLANQFVTRSDFRLLIMALKGLKSSYDNDRVNTILDRYLAMAPDAGAISVDYGVTQEGQDVQKSLQVLEAAIEGQLQVQFAYQNVHGDASQRVVNPLQLKFKWYAWYLYAMDTGRGEMRTFKVARMREVQANGQAFAPPPDVHALVEAQEAAYMAQCEWITLSCSAENLPLVQEYFADAAHEPDGMGGYIVRFHVPLSEPMWRALILGMGGRVKVLSPASYRDSLIETATAFLANYDIKVSR